MQMFTVQKHFAWHWILAILQLLSLPNMLCSNLSFPSNLQSAAQPCWNPVTSHGLVQAPPTEDGGAGRTKEQGWLFKNGSILQQTGILGKFTSHKCKDERIQTGGKEMKSGWWRKWEADWTEERKKAQWMMGPIFHQQADELHCQKEEKNLKIDLLLCMHAQSWSLYETKGTREGHFITRHATPKCTKIDHKSSSEELFLILKCGSINKTPWWQKCERKWMSGKTPRIWGFCFFFKGGVRWIGKLCIHENDSVVLRPWEGQYRCRQTWRSRMNDKARVEKKSCAWLQEPGGARWQVNGLCKDVKSVGNWADEGDIWSLETRVWRARRVGACRGNRCNYSVCCTRSGGWGSRS